MFKRNIKRQRGFFTIAQNSPTSDYVRIAYAQALSLKATQLEVPWLSIGVTSGTIIPDKYKEIFDEIIEIPWGDCAKNSQWKLENEWKVYHITPYEETIKLDADMLFLSNISNKWNILSNKNINVCSSVKTYHNEIIKSDFYRKDYTNNNLPNIYSAMFYFKLSPESKLLFKKFQDIYKNWDIYSRLCMPKNRPSKFTTDTGLALAIKLLWYDRFCADPFLLSFTHMKSQLQNWVNVGSKDFLWTQFVPYYFTNDLELIVGNIKQTGIFHYHDNTFLTDDIISKYEKRLGI